MGGRRGLGVNGALAVEGDNAASAVAGVHGRGTIVELQSTKEYQYRHLIADETRKR